MNISKMTISNIFSHI